MRTRTLLLVLLPACFFLSAFVEVKDSEMRASMPRKVPRIVYIADFMLVAEDTGDKGGGILRAGRLGQRIPKPFAKEDHREKSQHIVETMSNGLTRGLTEKGFPAQRLVGTEGILPRQGWLIQGVFTELGEGNRLRRAAIGFGAGSTSMEIQLGISDLESSDPLAPFAVFGTEKSPNLMPGAIISKNPYVLAAKFVLQKNATEKDTKATAAQIVEEVLKYRGQIAGKLNQAK